MPHKLLALIVSSALLWTGIAANAAPATAPAPPAQASAPQSTANTGNRPPLPPGHVRIKAAQGLEDDDLGPGVIIAGAAIITGLLFWMLSDNDDDDNETPPTTGTN